ncbi:serine hydrolase domain-containing protein [Haloglomus halophilum]|uniref:serine hydrolase domain-containing protein n=1 Tax=Haloglomus halophilum TaxID=2962672 RepID=UPI0020CA0A38|nr:serine hydrolase domain-containing protein [Haloglomus halophilum]
MPVVDGTAADGFGPVVDAFAENFRSRNELGAACTVYHEGECVVDIWGGYRDTAGEQPWAEHTMAMAFSGTKGMAATATAVALSRGLFALEDRIADHWPEFARHGKETITVQQLLRHRSGLATLDEPVTAAQLADHDELAEVLAAQNPDWGPGTRHGYHTFTLGWYTSELFRRTDGRTVGEFFADEVADPLDAEFHIGLPESVPDERVAELDPFGPVQLLRNAHRLSPRYLAALLNPRSLSNRAANCVAYDDPTDLTEPPLRSVEIPSANGIGTARGLAQVYDDLATGGDRLGIDEATYEELTTVPTPPSGGDRDLVVRIRNEYDMGYSKPYGEFTFGSSDAAFGTPGFGGTFGFADPDADLAFAYVPNRLGVHLVDDPREVAVREAVYDCLQ